MYFLLTPPGPVETQDSFDKEVDENGIIWDVDEDSDHLLMESRRFSPYGSEMKSPSIQRAALLEESDSLDSVPVRDQCGEDPEYLSEGPEEASLNSLSCHTYPPHRKRVNFQTPSGHSDPMTYKYNKIPSKHRQTPKSVGYDILTDDTDEDEYEKDFQRWREFTEEINLDLQRGKDAPYKLQKDFQGGKSNSQPLFSIGSSDKSQLSHRSEPVSVGQGGQGCSWPRKYHPVNSQSFMTPFAEPLQRTVSSPGLYKRYMRKEDVSYFPHSFSSSWQSSNQRGRYMRDVNPRLSSSLSSINMRAQSEHQPRTSICRDSSTQTWLLDRQLTEKDLHYMREISSSVSSSAKISARKSQPSNDKFKSTETEIEYCKSCSNKSSLSDKSTSSPVISQSNKSVDLDVDENKLVSFRDEKSGRKTGMSQNASSSSSDIPLNKLFQETSVPHNNNQDDNSDEKGRNKQSTGSAISDDGQNTHITIDHKSIADSEGSTSMLNNSSEKSEKKPTAGIEASSRNSASLSSSASEKTSLKNVKSDSSDILRTASKSYTQNLRQQSGNSNEVGLPEVADQHCDELIEDGTEEDHSFTSKSDSESKSKRNQLRSLSKEEAPDEEFVKNSDDTSNLTPDKRELSKSNGNKSLEIRDNVLSDDLDTISSPSKRSPQKSDHSVCSPEEADDTSVMTELSLNSNVADISYQSSNFSDFFKENSMTSERKAEEMEDPDKDKDCLEEVDEHQTEEPVNEEIICEGRQDRNNAAKLQKQKTMSPVEDFEPFSMEFEGGARAAVFSEVQETEDEDDLSTLDSCSVTLSSSEGKL